MADKKPILCLDLDGVLHSYTSGWQGADVIPDPSVDGFAEFMLQAIEHFHVAIHSSRSAQDGGVAAMRQWLWRALLDHTELTPEEATRWLASGSASRSSAFLALDDRALTFTGQWPSIAQLQAFKPWWQKEGG